MALVDRLIERYEQASPGGDGVSFVAGLYVGLLLPALVDPDALTEMRHALERDMADRSGAPEAIESLARQVIAAELGDSKQEVNQ